MDRKPASLFKREKGEKLNKHCVDCKMGQQSKEPCKKEACDIQACLTKNNFNSQKCLDVIEKLQSCCERCNYNSTHCASVSGLLKQHRKHAKQPRP